MAVVGQDTMAVVGQDTGPRAAKVSGGPEESEGMWRGIVLGLLTVALAPLWAESPTPPVTPGPQRSHEWPSVAVPHRPPART